MNGKKTYIAAAGAIVYALAGGYTGTLSLPEAAQMIVTAVLGATLRHGIATSTPK